MGGEKEWVQWGRRKKNRYSWGRESNGYSGGNGGAKGMGLVGDWKRCLSD